MSDRGANLKTLLFKASLGLVITTALVVLLLRYADLHQIGTLLAGMDPGYCLLSFALWALVYAARAVRFSLLAPKTPYLTMLFIASVHSFLLRILPMRTGELSYGLLVRRAGTAGFGESLLGLLLLRILDGTVVVVIFAAMLGLHGGIYLGDRRVVLAATGTAALGIVVVFTLGRLLRIALRSARGAARLLRIAERASVQRALAAIEESVGAFSRLRPWTTLRISATSVFLWLLTFSAFFAIMRGFSMPVGIAQTVLGSTAAVVTGFLPIGGIGSFGTMEAGWALGFVLVGLQRDQAVVSGFGVSLITFAFAGIMGLIGWIGLGIASKKEPTREHR